MKNVLKKILFPYFDGRYHDFLIKKWWFRLAIVLYAIGIIVLLFLLFSELSASHWGWCFDRLDLYAKNSAEYTHHYNLCREILEEYLPWVLSVTCAITVIIYYTIQFIFFKIIINLIVLRSKK